MGDVAPIGVGDRVQHHHRDPSDIGVVVGVDNTGYVWVALDSGERMGGPMNRWIKLPETVPGEGG